MKKKLSCLVILLLVCVSVFAGCSGSGLSVQKVSSNFQTNAESLIYKSSTEPASYILQKEGETYRFEYKANSNTQLYSQISLNGNDYSILQNTREYATILNHASKYFFTKFLNTNWQIANSGNFKNIPQTELSILNDQANKTIKAIENFQASARKLSENFTTDTMDTTLVVRKREDLLKNYQALISQVFELNFQAQDICDFYVNKVDEDIYSAETISTVEIARLVDSFELYITEYLFQRYMVFGGELDVDFSSNALLTKLNSVISKLDEKVDNKTLTEKTNSEEIIYLRNSEKTLKNRVEINRQIVETLDAKKPNSDDSYKMSLYNNFVSYENELMTYLNLLNNLIS